MSVLCGFSQEGPAQALTKMEAALAPRGQAHRRRAVSARGAISLAIAHQDSPQPLAIWWEDQTHDEVLAIAGQLWRADGEAFAPEAFMASLRRGEDVSALLNSLRGAWVMVARQGQRWWLARDGAGHRALYYGQCQGQLVFGVEPKAVVAYPGFERRLNVSSLARYMAFSYSPGQATMLQDVHELMPGHWLSWSPQERALTQRRYFIFEDAEPERFDEPEEVWPERFVQAFERAIASRLPTREGEPLGLFLSGGIDSSVVAAQLQRQRPGPLRTFSIHFGPEYPHELDFARAVAERCGTEHEEVLIRPKDFLPRLRQIIYALDDPIGDPITVPNFELARYAASQGLRVIFNGEGGDPCFGGPKNLTMMMHHWYGGIEEGPRARERAYLASYRRAYEELRHVLAPPTLAQIDEARDLEGVLSPFFEVERPRLFLHKLLAINIRLKGGHLILPKVERMYGASGLVAQSPLFDEEIIRLAFSMPGDMKVRGAVEKYVIKQAYQDALPKQIIDRPKSGMRVPVHYWFQKDLRRYARHILSPREIKRAGIFDPARVKQLLRYETEEGPGRYGIRLWMLLTFELWRRLVIEGESP